MGLNKWHALVLGASLALGACAGMDRTIGAAPSIAIADLETLPEPEEATAYIIGPQERVEIAVIGADQLSGVFLTDTAGNLDFPLLGTLPTAGLSPSQASSMIEDGLRGDYLLNPQVRLIPEELPKASVSVGGQVESPGAYPASGRLSLLRAINIAGGLSEYAKHDDVLILRSVRGQDYVGVYNIGAIQRGNYPDPAIFPDDIVMVGDNPERRRIDSILEVAAPVIGSTAVIINQLNN